MPLEWPRWSGLSTITQAMVVPMTHLPSAFLDWFLRLPLFELTLEACEVLLRNHAAGSFGFLWWFCLLVRFVCVHFIFEVTINTLFCHPDCLADFSLDSCVPFMYSYQMYACMVICTLLHFWPYRYQNIHMGWLSVTHVPCWCKLKRGQVRKGGS